MKKALVCILSLALVLALTACGKSKQPPAQRHAGMNRVHEKRPIKHRFAYILKMVKADAGTV